MESGGRLSLIVIAVWAAIALAAGGAWWVATAPDVAQRPTGANVVGEVPEDEEVFTPPDEAEQAGGDPENALPVFDGALERTIQRLDPNTGIAVFVESDKDARYLVQYVCLGPGSLQIRVEGVAGGSELHEVDCAGSFDMFEVVGSGGQIAIHVFRSDSTPAEVGLQLIPAR